MTGSGSTAVTAEVRPLIAALSRLRKIAAVQQPTPSRTKTKQASSCFEGIDCALKLQNDVATVIGPKFEIYGNLGRRKTQAPA